MIQKNMNELNKYQLVLVEGDAKKSSIQSPTLTGRSDGNKRCVFEAKDVLILDKQLERNLYEQFSSSLLDESNLSHTTSPRRLPLPGDYVIFVTKESKGQTLYGQALAITTLLDYQEMKTYLERGI